MFIDEPEVYTYTQKNLPVFLLTLLTLIFSTYP